MKDACRRRTVLRGIAGGAAVASLSGCIGAVTDSNQPVKFGLITPLSGQLERVGTHHKRTVEQAAADINRAGGIDGREVEVSAVDSELDPEKSVEKFGSLVDSGIVGLVGGLTSGVSMALVPEAADAGVMTVSPSSTSPQLTDAGRSDGRKYFGRTVSSDAIQAAAMAKVMHSSQYLGAESVALLSIDNSFGAGLAQAQRSNLDADVVADVRYDPSVSSFDDVLAETFANDPDAVGFTSVSGQEHGILDAYAQSEYEAPWVFSAGMFGGELPSFYEGFYSASLSSTRTDGYFDIAQRLSDITPLASYSENAYDALFLMAMAAEQAGEISGTAIADTIQSVSGGSGHTISVGEFDRVRSLVEAGRELNYRGASGPLDLTADLEPLSSYLIQHVEDGSVVSLELLNRQFFQSGGDQ